ncbi:MAG: DUF4390 domain-containing protein [Gemmatimonadetes bacterium]|nr:DUF4390 domain-containing protein [Gemmatimonadota bacterium]NIQ58517.1 DUF4390 domain-containing protein [Gemmatimonadota bacterium]NIU78714.1 DUF4390 domain-containing protein [Gammaproteobacteria bacterium]NIX47533.1 DUF4390 domain-containing protein [Gemmatimonadota bacterium]NIY11903.1 DUF4390 domain-containing protein [Gemmatimonadota bacterium]
MTLRAALLAAAAALFTAARLPAQSPLVLDVENGALRVAIDGVLADDALEEAIRSGLPLRLRFRVELWRDEWFDDLADQAAWSAVVAFEPLDRSFLVAAPGAAELGRFPTYDEAATRIERVYVPTIRPPRSGRYYYIAYLELETLSLSDLDELERWLRGELEPVVRGGRSVTGAVGTGLKRILIRVLGLPARRYEARSQVFRVP